MSRTRKFLAGLISMGLISAVVAVVLSVGPASALATEVKPTSTTFVGNLQAGTLSVFIPSNAYSEEAIGCTTSEIKATTPAEGNHKINQNKPKIGTTSAGYGSVIIKSLQVSFGNCDLYTWESTAKIWLARHESDVLVTTSTTNGNWSLAAYKDGTNGPLSFAAVAVPKAGIKITYLNCTTTVTPAEASSVFGEWHNGSLAEVPSKDRVDGQLEYTAAGTECIAAESPFQWEATYVVKVTLREEGILIEA